MLTTSGFAFKFFFLYNEFVDNIYINDLDKSVYSFLENNSETKLKVLRLD